MARQAKSIKCVAVGDPEVGKTALLITYAGLKFPEEYQPTLFDNFSKIVMVDGVQLNLALWDTAGQEDYDRLRPISYTKTDVFVLCFNVVNLESFSNIKTKWYPEVKHYRPDAHVILVGTKTDLREPKTDFVTREKGEKLANEIKAVKYVECSAKKGEGVAEVFDAAVRAFLFPPKPKKKQTLCNVL